MLGGYKKQSKGSEIERLEPDLPNFRVLDSDGYSSVSVMEKTSTLPVVYVMTSIFNGLFTKQESLQYMMKEMALAFPGKDLCPPILYINSSQLQKITQPWMFRGIVSKKDPVAQAEEKWSLKMRESEEALLREKIPFKNKILQWRLLLNHPFFLRIYPFFQSTIVGTSEVRDRNPTVDSKVFDRLEERAQNAGLPDKITEAVNLFVSHNQRIQKGTSGVTLAEEDHKALCTYMAQEFSVFLMLGCLDKLQNISTYFDLRLPASLTDETLIKPMLAYPISASVDGLAEKTFRVFLSVQELYIEFQTELNLPTLNQPLAVIDSLVRSLKVTKDASSRSSSEGEYIPLASSNTFCPVTIKPAQIDGDYRDKATNILAHIEKYVNRGVIEVEGAYENGVTCDVSVIKEKTIASLKKEAVIDIIKMSVEDVLTTAQQARIKFIYEGHAWTLLTRLTPNCKLASERRQAQSPAFFPGPSISPDRKIKDLPSPY